MALYRYQIQQKTEADFKEKSDQQIEADIEVMPSIYYNVGEVHDILGVGEVFEGGYKLTSVKFSFSNGELSVKLKGTKIREAKNGIVNNRKREKSKEEAPMKSKKTEDYVVKSGDNLWDIARKQLGDASKWKEIEEANREQLVSRDKRNSNKKGHWIYPGMTLKIPK